MHNRSTFHYKLHNPNYGLKTQTWPLLHCCINVGILSNKKKKFKTEKCALHNELLYKFKTMLKTSQSQSTQK